MDENINEIGTAIIGALAARAVEPSHGEGGDATARLCANCSTEMIGTHCHFCGQQAHVHRSLAAIGHDLIHGVLHLDGKFWRTLPLLVWRPGELTRRYAHGERAKFVSPLAMFLFAVFLMFAVLSIYGISLANLDTDGDVAIAAGAENVDATVDEQLAGARARRRDLQRLIDAAPDGAAAPALRREAAQLDRQIRQLREARSATERIADPLRVDQGTKLPRTGWARLDHGIEKINENPGLALYKLQSNFYKFSWLLIPISVPFVWILFFWTRRFRLYDHAVFVTYSLAFMSLLAIVLTVASFAGVAGAWIPLAAMMIPLWHMHRQLKGAYRLGWFGAIVRTALLALFCFVTSTIFFVLLLGIGALG